MTKMTYRLSQPSNRTAVALEQQHEVCGLHDISFSRCRRLKTASSLERDAFNASQDEILLNTLVLPKYITSMLGPVAQQMYTYSTLSNG